MAEELNKVTQNIHDMDVSTREGVLAGVATLVPLLGKLYLSYRASQIEKKKVEESRNQALSRIDEIYEHFMNEDDGIKRTLKTVAQDIKKLQTEVRALRAETEADKRISSDAIFETDAEGACIWVNPTLCKMYGLTFEEMLGYGWVNAIVPEDQERAKAEWLEDLQANRVINRSYHIRDASNRLWLIRYTAVIIRCEDGEIQKVRGICHRHKPETNLFTN